VTAARGRYDVVVVGGGQAGLALGYFLARDGRRFTILEAAEGPAAAWRKRWGSLKLFTPVRYDSLPGLPFPGELDTYPGRDAVVEYLTGYAEYFNLPVQFDSEADLRAVGGPHGRLARRREEPRRAGLRSRARVPCRLKQQLRRGRGARGRCTRRCAAAWRRACRAASRRARGP
jgi:glycine/D-amino acid oxidase-like deaminating enzyme